MVELTENAIEQATEGGVVAIAGVSSAVVSRSAQTVRREGPTDVDRLADVTYTWAMPAPIRPPPMTPTSMSTVLMRPSGPQWADFVDSAAGF
ncbi:hypothetical protein [Streptomyces sp. NPDC056661]|uniref:hypothetical protein n=1 Tax=Streptomyces sp. NPDC056661 TaxID=3345898 RepID=UPI0036C046DB